MPNGIMSISGQLQALYKVAVIAKAEEPAKDESYILSEGQRQDEIEVIHINDKDQSGDFQQPRHRAGNSPGQCAKERPVSARRTNRRAGPARPGLFRDQGAGATAAMVELACLFPALCPGGAPALAGQTAARAMTQIKIRFRHQPRAAA